MLKHLTLTALFAAMMPVLAGADSYTGAQTEVGEADMQAGGEGFGQDCFYGVGPGSNCVRCICVDADTGAFEYYCSECIMSLD